MIAFGAAFSEDVTFDQDGPTRQGLSGLGTLRLADSQDYCAAISGFSAKGLTALDLRDIGFVSAGEASFSGTSVEGVLTVSDGAHTARITLIGNFTKTFVHRRRRWSRRDRGGRQARIRRRGGGRLRRGYGQPELQAGECIHRRMDAARATPPL